MEGIVGEYTDFGGDWAADPKNSFTMGGKAQSWSKRIGSEECDWGTDVARGVNLGRRLARHRAVYCISPALYEKYVNQSNTMVIDEWTLSLAMGANLATEMEEHYKTFITEEDFAKIAAVVSIECASYRDSGSVIEAIDDEPFLVGTSWTYFLKAIQWARKHGIRIFMDLRALPGSQNGWNHSGKSGSVNCTVARIANAQRTLTYLQILTEFASPDQYRDVVCVIGIVNDTLWTAIGQAGVFLVGAYRVALDQHPYLAFAYDYISTLDQMTVKPCSWAITTNQSSKAFGVTLWGEILTAINDCGLLNGIGSTPGAPNCAVMDDWASYKATLIAGLKQVMLATMDALQNFCF
ncbi:glycoside hydrolase superfamily [Mycena crocata]|nr:glycoside hydrolase superfamily [Mycena crocata]